MKLSLFGGGAVNLAYVGIKLFAGVASNSFFLISLSAYYALLFSLRFYLLGHIRKKNPGDCLLSELKRARNCGVLLFVMGLALSVIVFFVVYLNRGYRYPGILIYAVGGYTVYSVTSAFFELFLHGKNATPVEATTGIVKLTAALVSFLALESAVFERLGGSVSFGSRRIILGTTGGGICLAVLSMSVLMISRAHRKLRRFNEKTDG
ncbi:MAG: hypothetical protein IJC32_00085 [Clostridia bacterium]|nr:hypothetical protein [Clostridia bacterium]